MQRLDSELTDANPPRRTKEDDGENEDAPATNKMRVAIRNMIEIGLA